MQRQNDNNNFTNITSIYDSLETTPEIIKAPYLQLIALLETDEIYGALLKIKDIFELNIKIPLVILLSYIEKTISNSSDDTDVSSEFYALHKTLQEFMKDAVTYQLSMGNWQTISGALKRAKYDKLFNASASSIILEAIYKINLHNFESYTSIQENGCTSSIAAWRNKTIGHGALNCNKEEVRNDVLDKLTLLNNILLNNEQFYSKVHITISGANIIIKSTSDDSNIVITPFADAKNIYDISIFDSYNKKKKLAHKINYATGEKDTSGTLSSRLSKIDDTLQDVSTLSLINKGQSRNLTDSTIYNDEIEVLNALQNSTYSQGSYFSDWFIDCIDSYPGGVFLCCAERGMGKSAFSRAVNQLDIIKIYNNPTLSNYLKLNRSKLLIRTFNFNSYYNSNIITFFTKLKDIFTSELVVESNGTSYLKTITYISHEIDYALDNIKKAIKDDEFSETGKKNLFLGFLSTILSIWQDASSKEKLILILDGIDEIKKDASNLNISQWIPSKEELEESGIDDIYIVLTSRCADELVNNSQIATYINETTFTRSLTLKREIPKDNINIKSIYSVCYLKDIKTFFEIDDERNALILANSLEWRYNYLSAYNKIYSLSKKNDFSLFIEKPLEIYVTYLEKLSKSYSEQVKSLLNLLAITDEPLTIHEISYLLTGDSMPNFRLYGTLMDISNFLTIEKDANRGSLYNLSHQEWMTSINSSPYFSKDRNVLTKKLNEKYSMAINTLSEAIDVTSPDYDGEIWLLCNLEILGIKDFESLFPIISSILSGHAKYQIHRQLKLSRHIVKTLHSRVNQIQDSQLLYIYIMCQHHIAEYSIKSKAKSIYNHCVELCEKFSFKSDDFFSILNIINSYEARGNFFQFYNESTALNDVNKALDIISDSIKTSVSLIPKLELVTRKISLLKFKSSLLNSMDVKNSIQILDDTIQSLSGLVDLLKNHISVKRINYYTLNINLCNKTFRELLTNEDTNGTYTLSKQQQRDSIISSYYHEFLKELAMFHKKRSYMTSAAEPLKKRFHCESCIEIMETLRHKVTVHDKPLISDSDLAGAYVALGDAYVNKEHKTALDAYSKAINLLEPIYKNNIFKTDLYFDDNLPLLALAYIQRGRLFLNKDHIKMKADFQKAYPLINSTLSQAEHINGYQKEILIRQILPLYLICSSFLSEDAKEADSLLEKLFVQYNSIYVRNLPGYVDASLNILISLSSLLDRPSSEISPSLQKKVSDFLVKFSSRILCVHKSDDEPYTQYLLAVAHLVRANASDISEGKPKLADFGAFIKILNPLPIDSDIKGRLYEELKISATKFNLYDVLRKKFNLNI